MLQKIFSYFAGSLRDLILLSRTTEGGLRKMKIGNATSRLVADLKSQGVAISEEYVHVVDNNAIRHTLNSHSGEREHLRGQIPMTESLLERIPEVIDGYDTLLTSKNKRGQDVIMYSRSFADGVTIYVEEVRCGRKELAMDTMYIHKISELTDANR